MNINYRKGNREDLKEIGILVSQAVKHMEDCNIFQWDDLYPVEEDFQDDIEKEQLMVGTVDGEIAVIYTLNQECDEDYKNGNWSMPDSKFCVVHRLCVKPSFQNQGVARNTLNHMEQSLKANGIEAIRLDTFTENPYSVKLYENCGYQKVGYADWRKGRFYLMEKVLK